MFPVLLWAVTKKTINETPKIVACLTILSSILALSNLDIELRKFIKPIVINIITYFLVTFLKKNDKIKKIII